MLVEIDSTNREAARRAPDLSGPHWIMARKQWRGQGRMGRKWVDPVGNFAASLVLFPSEPLGQVALRSYAAALAVYDGLVEVGVGDDQLGVKWPNDVLVHDRKISGILLETVQITSERRALVIGIGVNLQSCPMPEEVQSPSKLPISLSELLPEPPSQDAFLNILARSYAHYETMFRAYGFGPLRTAWLKRCIHHNQDIAARLPHQIMRGEFDTLDQHGHLVLRLEDGAKRLIAAADLL